MVTVNADDQTRPLLGALLVGKHELKAAPQINLNKLDGFYML
jgi:hypothetical protein